MENLRDLQNYSTLEANAQVHRRTSSQCSRSPSPEPQQRSSPQLPSPPQEIILGLWPSASSLQVEHYIGGYQTLYPDAQIHLLHYSRAPTGNSVDSNVDSVLQPLIQCSEKGGSVPSERSVLLHLFGNDAAAQACRLLRAYRAETTSVLNVKAIMMDTAPKIVRPTFVDSIQSPRKLLKCVFMMFMAFLTWILASLTLWRSHSEARQTRQDLNDPFLLPYDARTCYVLAETDLLFSWSDNNGDIVGDDDIVSERKEYSVKRTSIDKGGRWNGDQERYWLAIEGVWNGRS